MSKKKVEEEEIRRVLSEVIELVKEVYGVGIKEIVDRISRMNMELGEVSRSVKGLTERMGSLDKNVAVLNERTNIMLKIMYALLGGTFGTLIGIILTLIGLLFR